MCALAFGRKAAKCFSLETQMRCQQFGVPVLNKQLLLLLSLLQLLLLLVLLLRLLFLLLLRLLLLLL